MILEEIYHVKIREKERISHKNIHSQRLKTREERWKENQMASQKTKTECVSRMEEETVILYVAESSSVLINK